MAKRRHLLRALDILTGIGDWAHRRLEPLPPEQLRGMWDIYIAGEYGGVNESLATLYGLAGNDSYLQAAAAAQTASGGRDRRQITIDRLGGLLSGRSTVDEDLLDAVLEAKRVKKRGALRRQKQYIGKLMGRLDDPEPVRAALELLPFGSVACDDERATEPTRAAHGVGGSGYSVVLAAADFISVAIDLASRAGSSGSVPSATSAWQSTSMLWKRSSAARSPSSP